MVARLPAKKAVHGEIADADSAVPVPISADLPRADKTLTECPATCETLFRASQVAVGKVQKLLPIVSGHIVLSCANVIAYCFPHRMIDFRHFGNIKSLQPKKFVNRLRSFCT